MGFFDVALISILAGNSLLIAGLTWLFRRPFMKHRRFPGYIAIPVKRREFIKTVSIIAPLSLLATLAIAYLLGPAILARSDVGFALACLQALAIFVLYDFGYYFLHRGMHHPRVMRFVHRAHHKARFPTATESLFQHPAELLSGLGLLAFCMWLTAQTLGPISPYAFLGMFLVYSFTNVFIHSGISLPGFIFAPVNALTRKHYVHHKDFNYNFASMSPLPDLLFGTARSFHESAGTVPGLIGKQKADKGRAAPVA